jgi:hypothetical protein
MGQCLVDGLNIEGMRGLDFERDDPRCLPGTKAYVRTSTLTMSGRDQRPPAALHPCNMTHRPDTVISGQAFLLLDRMGRDPTCPTELTTPDPSDPLA